MRNLTVTLNNNTVFNSKENILNPPQLVATRLGTRPPGPSTTTAEAVSSEDKLAKFQVYPNPANGSLTIKFAPAFFAGTVQLIDLSGRVVMTSLLSGWNSQTFSTGNFNDGVYILKIEKNNKKSSQRVVIKN